ncbi:hypothetical protein ACEP28_04890 [Pseudomonas aeruginosa]|jgi:hypothetical protein|uniref:hypothetical protein n=2 Tax=Pseudomonadales TaxID=72274 RepID=UPI00125F771E|nr:hypothetical protein [Pseudomonas aeruginosa]MCO3748014.1 hypothetical protein [Pseudomonas aeruginosa]BDC78658.1 hypothetical protein MRCP2_p3930 [Pseudomonas alcaligenes]
MSKLNLQLKATGAKAKSPEEASMLFKLAESQTEFESSPGTYHGFIEKRLKRRIDFTLSGKLLAMNTHGIVTKRTPMDDGKVWYSYTSKSDFPVESLQAEWEWVRSFSTGKDHIGLTYK